MKFCPVNTGFRLVQGPANTGFTAIQFPNAYVSLHMLQLYFVCTLGGGGLGKSTFCEAAATGDNYVHDIEEII